MNRPIDNYDDFLIYLTESKLDHKSKQRWEDDIAEVQNTAPKWDQMVAFLKTRFRSLEVGANRSTPSQEKSNQYAQANNIKSIGSSKPPAVESSTKSASDDVCLFCKKKHRLTVCFTFQKKPYNERQAFVNEKKICSNCLSVSHKLSSCASTHICRICQQRHHTLLHPNQQSSNVTSISKSSLTEVQNKPYFSTLLATALINIVMSMA